MVDAFNLMSKRVIFQEVCATSGDIIQLIPFVLTLYAFESPLFYNHRNRDGNVIIIPSAMGIHQGDPLGRALFVLAHLKALHSINNHFPSYLFPSITDDTHIIGHIPLYPLHMSTFRQIYRIQKHTIFKIPFQNVCTIIPFPTCSLKNYLKPIVLEFYHVLALGQVFGL